MSKQQHTAEPWHVYDEGDAIEIQNDGPYPIASTTFDHCRNRLQVSGTPISEEEFNREYDASCDKHIDGYTIDHRGVFVKDAAMSQEKAE